MPYNPEAISPNERQYLLLLDDVYYKGARRDDRTGTGTKSIFAPEPLKLQATHLFLPRTKRLFVKTVIKEVCWFFSGSTNVRDLGARIWDAWADESGDLGPTYGVQLEAQLDEFIERLRSDPMSRRHVLSTWDAHTVHQTRLPPCHGLVTQAYVDADGVMHWSTYQRSADVFIGLPFNLLSYQLMMHLVARAAGLKAGTLTYNIGDAHLYLNHLEQAHEQLRRWVEVEHAEDAQAWDDARVPDVLLDLNTDFRRPKAEDFTILDYNPMPYIPAEVST